MLDTTPHSKKLSISDQAGSRATLSDSKTTPDSSTRGLCPGDSSTRKFKHWCCGSNFSASVAFWVEACEDLRG